jgi:O-antigen/teichoic acid export membrane protein
MTSPGALLASAARLATGSKSASEAEVTKGAVGTLALNVSAAGLNFLITVVLTNALGASGYGAYAFAFAWSTVLTVPAVLGLSPLIIRGVTRYQIQGEWGLLRGLLRHLNLMVFISSLSLSAAAAAVGLAVMGTGSSLLVPYLIGLALVPIFSLTTMRQAAMQGLGRVVLGRVPETLLAPAVFLVLALALSSGLTAGSALAVQVAATGGAFLLGLWLLRRTVPGQARTAEPRYETRAWGASAARLTAMSLAGALSAQLAVLVLTALDTSTQAGIYQAATRTAMFVSFMFMAAGYAVSPVVARLQAENRHEELQALLTRSVRSLTICSAPVAVIFLVFAPQVLGVFGGGFTGGSLILRILVIGEVVRVATGFALGTLVTGGYEGDVMWVAGAGLALNVLLSFALIPPLGGEGAAIATTTGLIVLQVATVVIAQRRLSVETAVVRLPRLRWPSWPKPRRESPRPEPETEMSVRPS